MTNAKPFGNGIGAALVASVAVGDVTIDTETGDVRLGDLRMSPPRTLPDDTFSASTTAPTWKVVDGEAWARAFADRGKPSPAHRATDPGAR